MLGAVTAKKENMKGGMEMSGASARDSQSSVQSVSSSRSGSSERESPSQGPTDICQCKECEEKWIEREANRRHRKPQRTKIFSYKSVYKQHRLMISQMQEGREMGATPDSAGLKTGRRRDTMRNKKHKCNHGETTADKEEGGFCKCYRCTSGNKLPLSSRKMAFVTMPQKSNDTLENSPLTFHKEVKESKACSYKGRVLKSQSLSECVDNTTHLRHTKFRFAFYENRPTHECHDPTDFNVCCTYNDHVYHYRLVPDENKAAHPSSCYFEKGEHECDHTYCKENSIPSTSSQSQLETGNDVELPHAESVTRKQEMLSEEEEIDDDENDDSNLSDDEIKMSSNSSEVSELFNNNEKEAMKPYPVTPKTEDFKVWDYYGHKRRNARKRYRASARETDGFWPDEDTKRSSHSSMMSEFDRIKREAIRGNVTCAETQSFHFWEDIRIPQDNATNRRKTTTAAQIKPYNNDTTPDKSVYSKIPAAILGRYQTPSKRNNPVGIAWQVQSGPNYRRPVKIDLPTSVINIYNDLSSCIINTGSPWDPRIRRCTMPGVNHQGPVKRDLVDRLLRIELHNLRDDENDVFLPNQTRQPLLGDRPRHYDVISQDDLDEMINATHEVPHNIPTDTGYHRTKTLLQTSSMTNEYRNMTRVPGDVYGDKQSILSLLSEFCHIKRPLSPVMDNLTIYDDGPKTCKQSTDMRDMTSMNETYALTEDSFSELDAHETPSLSTDQVTPYIYEAEDLTGQDPLNAFTDEFPDFSFLDLNCNHPYGNDDSDQLQTKDYHSAITLTDGVVNNGDDSQTQPPSFEQDEMNSPVLLNACDRVYHIKGSTETSGEEFHNMLNTPSTSWQPQNIDENATFYYIGAEGSIKEAKKEQNCDPTDLDRYPTWCPQVSNIKSDMASVCSETGQSTSGDSGQIKNDLLGHAMHNAGVSDCTLDIFLNSNTTLESTFCEEELYSLGSGEGNEFSYDSVFGDITRVSPFQNICQPAESEGHDRKEEGARAGIYSPSTSSSQSQNVMASGESYHETEENVHALLAENARLLERYYDCIDPLRENYVYFGGDQQIMCEQNQHYSLMPDDGCSQEPCQQPKEEQDATEHLLMSLDSGYPNFLHDVEIHESVEHPPLKTEDAVEDDSQVVQRYSLRSSLAVSSNEATQCNTGDGMEEDDTEPTGGVSEKDDPSGQGECSSMSSKRRRCALVSGIEMIPVSRQAKLNKHRMIEQWAKGGESRVTAREIHGNINLNGPQEVSNQTRKRASAPPIRKSKQRKCKVQLNEHSTSTDVKAETHGQMDNAVSQLSELSPSKASAARRRQSLRSMQSRINTRVESKDDSTDGPRSSKAFETKRNFRPKPLKKERKFEGKNKSLTDAAHRRSNEEEDEEDEERTFATQFYQAFPGWLCRVSPKPSPTRPNTSNTSNSHLKCKLIRPLRRRFTTFCDTINTHLQNKESCCNNNADSHDVPTSSRAISRADENTMKKQLQQKDKELGRHYDRHKRRPERSAFVDSMIDTMASKKNTTTRNNPRRGCSTQSASVSSCDNSMAGTIHPGDGPQTDDDQGVQPCVLRFVERMRSDYGDYFCNPATTTKAQRLKLCDRYLHSHGVQSDSIPQQSDENSRPAGKEKKDKFLSPMTKITKSDILQDKNRKWISEILKMDEKKEEDTPESQSETCGPETTRAFREDNILGHGSSEQPSSETESNDAHEVFDKTDNTSKESKLSLPKIQNFNNSIDLTKNRPVATRKQNVNDEIEIDTTDDCKSKFDPDQCKESTDAGMSTRSQESSAATNAPSRIRYSFLPPIPNEKRALVEKPHGENQTRKDNETANLRHNESEVEVAKDGSVECYEGMVQAIPTAGIKLQSIILKTALPRGCELLNLDAEVSSSITMSCNSETQVDSLESEVKLARSCEESKVRFPSPKNEQLKLNDDNSASQRDEAVLCSTSRLADGDSTVEQATVHRKKAKKSGNEFHSMDTQQSESQHSPKSCSISSQLEEMHGLTNEEIRAKTSPDDIEVKDNNNSDIDNKIDNGPSNTQLNQDKKHDDGEDRIDVPSDNENDTETHKNTRGVKDDTAEGIELQNGVKEDTPVKEEGSKDVLATEGNEKEGICASMEYMNEGAGVNEKAQEDVCIKEECGNEIPCDDCTQNGIDGGRFQGNKNKVIPDKENYDEEDTVAIKSFGAIMKEMDVEFNANSTGHQLVPEVLHSDLSNAQCKPNANDRHQASGYLQHRWAELSPIPEEEDKVEDDNGSKNDVYSDIDYSEDDDIVDDDDGDFVDDEDDDEDDDKDDKDDDDDGGGDDDNNDGDNANDGNAADNVVDEENTLTETKKIEKDGDVA